MGYRLALILVANAAVLLAAVTILWRVAVRGRDVSIVDVFWGSGFVLVAVVTLALPGGDVGRKALLAVLTALWGLRLSAYLGWRARGRGEDRRYAAMRARVQGNFDRWALTRVFLLQGALIWFISLPIQVGGALSAPDSPTWPLWIGIALWLIGLTFEAVGDAQLARFRRTAAEGAVLDTGLWRFTRHPNYFGDACVWWGLFLVACTHPAVAATAVGPFAMTYLLVRVSGKPLLERDLRRRKPAYAAYIERTSGFIPWPPRRAAAVVDATGHHGE